MRRYKVFPAGAGLNRKEYCARLEPVGVPCRRRAKPVADKKGALELLCSLQAQG